MAVSSRDRTGLVVVDVQNGFCHPDGSRSRLLGVEVNRPAWEIVPKIVELVRWARVVELPIWFTRMVDRADDAGRRRHLIRTATDRRGRIDLCPASSWDAELVADVAAEIVAGDEVIVKHRASAFHGTRLEVEVRMTDVGRLLVVGTTTSFCIDSTIREATARDLDVVVIADCVADTRPDDHDAVLRSIARWHGTVVERYDDGELARLLDLPEAGAVR